MPQYAGMPEDRDNRRVDPCGCVFVRMALPNVGDRWVRRHECDEHKDDEPRFA